MFYRFFVFIFLTVFTVSCAQFSFYDQRSDEIVCSVGSYVLYESDLDALFSESRGGMDSVVMRKFYIDGWVKEKVELSAAAKVVSEFDVSTIDKLVGEYREALIVQAFQQAYINVNLDTVIDAKVVKEFYSDNLSQFELNEPLVKACIAQVPITVRNIDNLEKMFFGSYLDLNNFKTVCDKNSYKFVDMSGSWHSFSSLLEHVLLGQIEYNEFLKKNKFYISKDRESFYMVRIIDYIPAGRKSPIEVESDGIRKQILFNRRDLLLKQLSDSLQQAAHQSNDIVFSAL